jgi:hypothetical protein
MAEMVYRFKSGAHVPKGVTPEGILEERDRIEHDYGGATIENSVAAVLKHPDKYPNLRTFGPADKDAAWRDGIAAGIRRAYRIVVVVRAEPEQKVQARQVRVIHSVQDAAGDLVYKPIQAIRQSPSERKFLIGQLRRDADLFAERMRDTLAEIEEAT